MGQFKEKNLKLEILTINKVKLRASNGTHEFIEGRSSLSVIISPSSVIASLRQIFESSSFFK